MTVSSSAWRLEWPSLSRLSTDWLAGAEPAAASAYVLPGVVTDGLASSCRGTEPVDVPDGLAKGVSHDLHTSRVVQLYAWHFRHLISINVGVALSSLGLRLGFRLAGLSEGVCVAGAGGGARWEAP